MEDTMAQTTKPKRSATAPAKRKPAAAASRPESSIDRTTRLSEEVLDSVEKGQRAAIEVR
jgi:hypothetical protein